ncbi:MAG: acyltransferase [Bacteroidetes bacterium]|nr:acyltransferase [Bacteroidota bacterium]
MSQKGQQDLRIHYLDSWRGIAAVAVVLFHLLAPLRDAFHSKGKMFEITRVLFDGTDWVSFFFVLSGFALSYGYLVGDKKISISDFYIKRFLRIYPLYLFALGLCFLVEIQHAPYAIRPLMREAFLFSRFSSLLVPGWSLSVEICCSLLMPLIITLAMTNRYHFWLAAVFSLLLYNTPGTSQIGFAGFLFHFFLGAGVAMLMKHPKENPVVLYFHKMSGIKVVLLLLFGYLLFSFRWYAYIFQNFDYQIHRLCDFLNMDYHQIFFYISGVVSFMIILITIGNTQIQKILSLRPFLFLGKISFSIYLIHFPIIKFAFIRTYDLIKSMGINNYYFEALAIVLIIISMVLLVSYMTYISIEKPFINIAKKLVVSPKYLSLREKIKYNL